MAVSITLNTAPPQAPPFSPMPRLFYMNKVSKPFLRFPTYKPFIAWNKLACLIFWMPSFFVFAAIVSGPTSFISHRQLSSNRNMRHAPLEASPSCSSILVLPFFAVTRLLLLTLSSQIFSNIQRLLLSSMPPLLVTCRTAHVSLVSCPPSRPFCLALRPILGSYTVSWLLTRTPLSCLPLSRVYVTIAPFILSWVSCPFTQP